jgi:hypothetical protein
MFCSEICTETNIYTPALAQCRVWGGWFAVLTRRPTSQTPYKYLNHFYSCRPFYIYLLLHLQAIMSINAL